MKKQSLAKRLRELREEANLSMVAVAVLSVKAREHPRGVITQGYISRLESGMEDNPSMAKIITLAKIYGVDPNTIVGWE